MKAYTFQSSFNSGVLDASMNARVDVKQYYNGMSQGDNVLCIPQGGVKRRPGMEFIADAGEECRVIEFVFNLDQKYLMVLRNNAIDVYFNDAFQVTVITTYTTAQLMEIRYTQSADTMILIHGDHAPAQLVRGVSHSIWTLSNVAFVNIPQHDFNDSSSPTGVDAIFLLTFNLNVKDGDTFKLNLDGIDTDLISWFIDANGTIDAVEEALYNLPNTASSGITVTAPTTATINVVFSGANYGDWNGLTGRIIDYTGTKGNITASKTQSGVARSEDSWSAIRLWPKTLAFHEGRLWFGATDNLPVNLWGSNVFDFFDFELGRSRDDQGINIAIDAGQFDEILAIFSSRSLQVFTAGAEYYVPKSPITPENIAVLRQSGYGSKGVQPKLIDGATVYIQRTGKSVREFVYDFAEEAYLSSTIVSLSPELIDNPVDMAISSGTSKDDSNYVYVVNSSGELAVFNTLREQNVAGWSKWITNGEILNIVNIGDDLYFSVKRTINSVVEYYVEKSNINAYTDSAKLYTTPATDILTGLTHLNGEEVRVRADEAVLSSETVASNQITIDRTAADSAEVGLNYDATVVTMPVEKDVGAGFNINGEKRIVNCTVMLKETLGITINGFTVPFKTFGIGVLDQQVTPFTGKKEMYLLGWDKTAQATIKQVDPTPMTLLGVNLEVEFG